MLSNLGNEKPWCIDSHIYHDASADRLWMTWGGHALWISELDKTTGKILDPTKYREPGALS